MENIRYVTAIDSVVLLSYELEKVTLKNNTFEKLKKNSKCDGHSDSESHLSSLDGAKGDKSIVITHSNIFQGSTSESSLLVQKLPTNIMNHDEPEDVSDSDNEVHSTDDVNSLLRRLQITDSGSEQGYSSSENEIYETNRNTTLREKGPETRKKFTQHKQSPFDKKECNKKHINSENLDVSSAVYSYDSPRGIKNCVRNTSEEFKPRNIEHSTEDYTTCGDNSLRNQTEETISDEAATSLYPEDSGTNSVGSSKSECDPCITGYELLITNSVLNHDLDYYAQFVNNQDFNDLLIELGIFSDYATTACSLLESDKEVPQSLQEAKTEHSTDTVAIAKNNRRKNKALNAKNAITNKANVRLASLPLENAARATFRAFLCDDKIFVIQRRIYQRIIRELCEELKSREDVKVIYIENEGNSNAENRTNLHNAVLNFELEEIYCLVEIHINYSKLSFTELTLTDKHGKTAIDYAIQNDLTPVVEYLKGYHCRPSDQIIPCTLKKNYK